MISVTFPPRPLCRVRRTCQTTASHLPLGAHRPLRQLHSFCSPNPKAAPPSQVAESRPPGLPGSHFLVPHWLSAPPPGPMASAHTNSPLHPQPWLMPDAFIRPWQSALPHSASHTLSQCGPSEASTSPCHSPIRDPLKVLSLWLAWLVGEAFTRALSVPSILTAAATGVPRHWLSQQDRWCGTKPQNCSPQEGAGTAAGWSTWAEKGAPARTAGGSLHFRKPAGTVKFPSLLLRNRQTRTSTTGPEAQYS